MISRDRARKDDIYDDDDDAVVTPNERILKTDEHKLKGNISPEKEKKLVDNYTILKTPDHHQDTQPKVGSPHHHLAGSSSSKSPSPNQNHHHIYSQTEAIKDELWDKETAHSDTYD